MPIHVLVPIVCPRWLRLKRVMEAVVHDQTLPNLGKLLKLCLL